MLGSVGGDALRVSATCSADAMVLSADRIRSGSSRLYIARSHPQKIQTMRLQPSLYMLRACRIAAIEAELGALESDISSLIRRGFRLKELGEELLALIDRQNEEQRLARTILLDRSLN